MSCRGQLPGLRVGSSALMYSPAPVYLQLLLPTVSKAYQQPFGTHLSSFGQHRTHFQTPPIIEESSIARQSLGYLPLPAYSFGPK